MTELSLLVKLGALLVVAVGALIVATVSVRAAVKIARWIFEAGIDTPPAPVVASQPAPDTTTLPTNVTPLNAYGRELRTGT